MGANASALSKVSTKTKAEIICNLKSRLIPYPSALLNLFFFFPLNETVSFIFWFLLYSESQSLKLLNSTENSRHLLD